MASILLHAEHISCRRELIRDEPSVVREIDLTIETGSQVELRGETGCGKLLLLHLVGLLESPDAGEIYFAGQKTTTLDVGSRTIFRNRHVGILLDEPGLLPGLTVAENIAMPMFKVLEIQPQEARRRTESILAELCIEEHQDVPAGELPRFEQHVVSFARALAVSPALLIAESEDHLLSVNEHLAWQAIVSKVAAYHGLTLVRTAGARSNQEWHGRVVSLAHGRVIHDKVHYQSSNN